MRTRVDADKCQGHAVCNRFAPGVFKLRDEDGRAYVESEGVPAEFEEQAKRAALSCPEQAIELDP
ncbi:MAG: ferredoxin [Proteobacteria bacterium]|nr:ferredoxin [Pseudomonadota bacterium]